MYDFNGLNTLADISRQQAKKRGNSPAFWFEGRETTFSAFDKHTSQVANGLIALGQKPHARVGYMGMNSDRYFEVLLGACKANTVLVGINWRLAGPEVVYVLSDAGCETMFVGAEFVPLIEAIKGHCPKLKHIIAVDGGHKSWPAYADWRDKQSDKDPHLPIKSDDDAIQPYTSGTTGHPKGLMKESLSDLLPPDILDRKKRGFGTPMGAWLKRNLAPVLRQLLSKETVARRGLFRHDVIARLMADHESNRSDGTDSLLSLMNLEIWSRIYLDRREPGDVAVELKSYVK